MSAGDVLPQELVNEFVGASHGNAARVRQLLGEHPSLVQSVAEWGETPIQAATQTGQREIIDLLLAAGAPLDICTAAMLGDRERVAAFLSHDAALARATGAHGSPLMYFPACSGRVDIAELILARGASVNGGDGASPPLHGTVYFDQPAMSEWLLAHGAHPDVFDYQGKTALQRAIDDGKTDVASVLRRAGAKAMAKGFAKVQGGKLYYETAGEGSALLLVHAGVADCRMWDDQIPVFAGHYRVIRFDLRGFGQSQSEAVEFSFRQDIVDLLNHLGVKRAHVLGCSIGGQIAIDFTLEHPEMVDALIPVAAGLSGFEPGDGGGDARSQVEARLFHEMVALWEKKDLPALREIELQMWVDGPMQAEDRVPAAIREKVRQMIAGGDAHAGEGATSKRLDPPAIGRLSEIKAPALVIVGDLDASPVLAACDILAREIAAARMVVVPGTAHMLNMESPDEFNRLVLDFLGRLEGSKSIFEREP